MVVVLSLTELWGYKRQIVEGVGEAWPRLSFEDDAVVMRRHSSLHHDRTVTVAWVVRAKDHPGDSPGSSRPSSHARAGVPSRGYVQLAYSSWAWPVTVFTDTWR